MKNHVRVIYDPSVAKDHTAAILRGVKSLERFGVLVDEGLATERAAVKPVRLGRYIRGIIEERTGGAIDFKCWGIRVADAFAFSPKEILGFGVLEDPLLLERDGKVEETVGAGRFGDIALLSLFRFMEIRNPQLRLKALEVAAKHEAAHLFKAGHCTEPTCVMQPKPVVSKSVLVESILLRPDFCRDCEREINAKVSLREYELNHISGAG